MKELFGIPIVESSDFPKLNDGDIELGSLPQPIRLTDIYGEWYVLRPEDPILFVLQLSEPASVESKRIVITAFQREEPNVPLLITDPRGSIMCSHDMTGLGLVRPANSSES
jgi:hypothetical protein